VVSKEPIISLLTAGSVLCPGILSHDTIVVYLLDDALKLLIFFHFTAKNANFVIEIPKKHIKMGNTKLNLRLMYFCTVCLIAGLLWLGCDTKKEVSNNRIDIIFDTDASI
jgi:hypothetical protein